MRLVSWAGSRNQTVKRRKLTLQQSLEEHLRVMQRQRSNPLPRQQVHILASIEFRREEKDLVGRSNCDAFREPAGASNGSGEQTAKDSMPLSPGNTRARPRMHALVNPKLGDLTPSRRRGQLVKPTSREEDDARRGRAGEDITVGRPFEMEQLLPASDEQGQRMVRLWRYEGSGTHSKSHENCSPDVNSEAFGSQIASRDDPVAGSTEAIKSNRID